MAGDPDHLPVHEGRKPLGDLPGHIADWLARGVQHADGVGVVGVARFTLQSDRLLFF